MLFALLAASGAVDRVQGALPSALKSSITVAIGVFQAFVGLQLMGLVVKSDTTLVALGDLSQPNLWLAFTATLLVAGLLIRKVTGALLLGICFTAAASYLLGLPNPNQAWSLQSLNLKLTGARIHRRDSPPVRTCPMSSI